MATHSNATTQQHSNNCNEHNDTTTQQRNDAATTQRLNSATTQRRNDTTTQRRNEATTQRSNDATTQRRNDTTTQQRNDATHNDVRFWTAPLESIQAESITLARPNRTNDHQSTSCTPCCRASSVGGCRHRVVNDLTSQRESRRQNHNIAITIAYVVD